jgi:excisionase family DNA binding protein
MQLSFLINDVAELTGIGKTKIYALINSRSLKARKLGKRTIILREDLDAFLCSLEAYQPPSKK